MRRVIVTVGLLVGLLAGCNGVPAIEGVKEPLRVPAGYFLRGGLPGSADATSGPSITSASNDSGNWTQGQLGVGISGRATEETYSIGVDFAELGSGYWVVPVGAINPVYGTEREWHIGLDVGGWLPAGNYTVRVVAIDADGNGGKWQTLPVCVIDPSVPDDGNACIPTKAPPDTVISLQWDLNVDLDLVVFTPSGKRVDHGHPTTAPTKPDGTVDSSYLTDPLKETIGFLDHDSDAECIPDGRNAESLVFQEPTSEPGTYGVYADLFNACGFPSVRFTATVYRRQMNMDGTYELVSGESTTGLIEAISASGGANEPLFVMNVSLP